MPSFMQPIYVDKHASVGRFEGGRDATQYREGEEVEGDGERGGAALLQKHPHPPPPSVCDSWPYQRGEEECGDYRVLVLGITEWYKRP